jgi:BirA family biotin operon repressor/biotin-[acetyl-CoA-carboxylase] ligase
MLVPVDLPLTRALASRLVVLDEAGSTNDVLAASAAGDEPHLSTVLTLNQTGGRGRMGRVWVAPPGRTLAVSVLLRPVLPGGAQLGIEYFGWLPLIAGVAMSRAVDSLIGGGRTRLKWPNDVQVDGRKICGVLAELVAGGDAVIVGSGVNLLLDESELPVPTATSLALAGAAGVAGLAGAAGAESPAGVDALVDTLTSRYLGTMTELLDQFLVAGADSASSGIRRLVSEWCSTLGSEVRVELPGGSDLIGTAVGIDDTGRLVVRHGPDAQLQAVAAGDVTHLRYE